MLAPRFLRGSRLAGAVVAVALSAFADAGEIDAVWVGGGSDGLWSTAANWDVAVVPCNVGPIEFDVAIPAGFAVTMNVAGCVVSHLSLAAGSSLTVTAGSDLEVLGNALVGGHVDANGGQFAAEGPGADVLDGGMLGARAGGVLAMAVQDPGYSSAPLPHATTFFYAEGPGSMLRVSGLAAIDVPNPPSFNAWHEILAAGGGTIELPDLVAINGPSFDFDTLFIDVTAGSSLLVDSLQTLAGTTGRTVVHAIGTQLHLPALAAAERVIFEVDAGGCIEAPALEQYSSAGLPHATTFFDVDGAGSKLSLAGLTSLDVPNPPSFNAWHEILATGGGTIELPALATIDGPSFDFDTLFIDVLGGSSLLVDSLQTLAGTTGRTVVHVIGTQLHLPALTVAERVVFEVDGGGCLEAPALEHYSSAGLPHATTFFDVDGAGSTLSLAGLAALDVPDPPSVNAWHQIFVRGGGRIDLPALFALNTSVDGSDTLFLAAANGDTLLNAPSLQVIAGAGQVTVTIQDGAELRTGHWEGMTAPLSVTLQTGAARLRVGGDLRSSGSATLTLSGPETHVDVDGALCIGAGTLPATAAQGGVFEVAGRSLCQSGTSEASAALDGALVRVDGSGGVQRLEVGGLDVADFCMLLSNDNFGFGQLVVGTDEMPTTLRLQDHVDNGNGGGGNPEALYLFGLGPDRCNGVEAGLRILGGSTLQVPESMALYAWSPDAGALVSVADGLEGVTAFDEGFIEIIPAVRGDADGSGVTDVEDLVAVILEWGECPAWPAACDADLNCDGIVDVTDLVTVVLNWS